MRKADSMKRRLLTMAAALVLGLGIFGWGFAQGSLVSHAESQAKVTAPKGANIRKEASTTSAAVGGAENGKILTVISQVQGGDGNIWYQVKSGDITGYIRSDLVEVTEGSAPAEGGEAGGEGGGAAPSDVTAVNPVSAAVSGDSGKIRDSASSEGQIIAEVPEATMLTVTGQATDADGRTWYRVNYISGENQVEGFIRYDYVTLAGELTPAGENPAAPEEPTAPAEPEPETKLYDTLIQDGAWLLVDNTGGEPKGYPIDQLFNGVQNNATLFEENEKTIKNQKVIIIVLVFLLVGAAAGIAYLVYKLKDTMDSAYFNEVEKDALRRRQSSSGGQRSARAPGRDSGASRPAGARTSGYGQEQAGRANPQRPAGSGQRSSGAPQGQRPSGASQSQRPSGASQGQRPSGTSQGQRPSGASQGQRPSGAPQGQRPAGTSQGQRPVRITQDPRPAGVQGTRTSANGQNQEADGVRPAARRPAGASQGSGQEQYSRSQGSGTAQGGRPVRQAANAGQKSQSRNFMAEDGDDDFEHEFLNYDE